MRKRDTSSTLPGTMYLRDIVGHRAAVEALITAHARDLVHHALLLAGPSGVGKALLARAFIAMVDCVGDAPVDEDGRRVDACGSCRACRRIQDPEAEHPDLLVLEPLPGSRVIKIEQVRNVLSIIPYPPLEAPTRFVLIEPADTLTLPAANGLLKTLEEPPSTTRFILLTSRPYSLLGTIRSRCQRLPLSRLTAAEVAQILTTQHGVDEARAMEVAPISDGSPGGALALLEDPVMSARDELIRRVAGIEPGAVSAAFGLAADFAEMKGSLPSLFEILSRLYRDLLLVRTEADGAVALSHPHLRSEILDPLAARYGVEALLYRLRLIAETEHGITHQNVPAKLAFERLLIALTAPAGREGARFHLRT